MLALLSLIPGIGTLIQFIVGKVYDAKVSITTAKIGGDVAVAKEIIASQHKIAEANNQRLAIMASNKLLLALLVAFAAPLVIYEWKVVVYDIVFASITHGTTDPIKGQVFEWTNSIIAFLFGSTTALALANMWFNRK